MSEPRGPSVTVFRPIVYALTQLGLEWKTVLESCGIDPDGLDDPDARVRKDEFDAFWPRAADLTGDSCFGLHLGEHFRPMAVNVLGYLLLSSSTAREGLERVAAYQSVVFDTKWFSLIDRPPFTLTRWEPAQRDPGDEAHQIEYKMMLLLRMLDWVTPVDFRAAEVRLRHLPAGPPEQYERAFGCPVKFQSPHSELVLSKSSLDQPSLDANPELARLHEAHAQRHLSELRDRSVTRRLKQLLMSQLDRGPCDLADAARSLHASPRTLQRRLEEEGKSFRAVLDSLRRELCLQHLEEPDTALAEIAYVAGFSDSSALTRAVRRWTGQTPLEYRRSHARPSKGA